LSALERQDYERDRFEVIVVDDGSPTPCAQVVEHFQRTLSLTLLVQGNAGPAKARRWKRP
jgi:glycosyltransferase involved in cell wall biosynthesis